MSELIIDAHAHVFPNPLAKQASGLKQFFRKPLGPWIEKLHDAQTYLRVLPKPVQLIGEEFLVGVPAFGLILEMDVEDLKFSMARAGVDKTVVIAHPPIVSNEFILGLARENENIIPVVQIPKSEKKPGKALRGLIEAGARAVKIHPASDGEDSESRRYQAVLRTAADLGIPVILHTGCFHSHLFYRSPHLGRAEHFESWFKEFSDVSFVLAHMNFEDPRKAIELAAIHKNLLLETSWQPAEVIGDAVRKVGSDRVMMGSDWPFVGHNQDVAKARVYQALDLGWITDVDLKNILSGTAKRVFKID